MKRSLKDIKSDLARVDRQISATLTGKFQTEEDRQITLEGFMKNKTALENEKTELLRNYTQSARGIEVKNPVVVSDQSGESRNNKEAI